MLRAGTGKLALQLFEAVRQVCGGRPFAVIARFHRKYVDANRNIGNEKAVAAVGAPATACYHRFHDGQ